MRELMFYRRLPLATFRQTDPSEVSCGYSLDANDHLQRSNTDATALRSNDSDVLKGLYIR
jgi:hypothetical protein